MGSRIGKKAAFAPKPQAERGSDNALTHDGQVMQRVVKAKRKTTISTEMRMGIASLAAGKRAGPKASKMAVRGSRPPLSGGPAPKPHAACIERQGKPCRSTEIVAIDIKFKVEAIWMVILQCIVLRPGPQSTPADRNGAMGRSDIDPPD